MLRLSLKPGAERKYARVVSPLEPPMQPCAAQIVSVLGVDPMPEQRASSMLLDVNIPVRDRPVVASCPQRREQAALKALDHVLRDSVFEKQRYREGALERLASMLDSLEAVPTRMRCGMQCTCDPDELFGKMLFRTCRWIVYQFEAFFLMLQSMYQPNCPELQQWWRNDFALATVDELARLLCLGMIVQVARLHRVLTYVFHRFGAHLAPYESWWHETREKVYLMALEVQGLQAQTITV